MVKNTLLAQLFLILLFVFGYSLTSFAQSEGEKTMIITIETVNENNKKEVKKLKFTGEEADESKVDEIVEEHVTGNEKSVNVNVEIESNSTSDSEEIHINGKKMDVRVDGEKVYLNGEEVKEGTFGDKTVRILRMDDVESEEVKDILNELNVEDADGSKIMFIETQTETVEEISSEKGFLGVHMSNESIDEPSEGVKVGRVTPDFPAANAGIQKGDLILKFNGTPTNSFEGLAKLIEAEKPGNTVDITYSRAGVSKTVEATLINRPGRRSHTFRWEDEEGNVHPLGDKKFKFKDAEGNEKVYTKKRCDKKRSCNKSNSCCDTDQDCCTKNGGSNNKARLGVGIAEGQGARVVSVNKNASAGKAGMAIGDDIIKLDKKVIGSVEDLISTLSVYESGDQVKVTYLRKGKKIKSKIVLDKTDISCCPPEKKKSTKIEKQRIIIKKKKDAKDIGATEMKFENDLKLDDLDVYPNPTSSEMNFKFKIAKKAPTEFKIVDIRGQEVFSDKIENFSGSYEKVFDFSNLTEGMYFFQINQKGKQFTEKIMYSKE